MTNYTKSIDNKTIKKVYFLAKFIACVFCINTVILGLTVVNYQRVLIIPLHLQINGSLLITIFASMLILTSISIVFHDALMNEIERRRDDK